MKLRWYFILIIVIVFAIYYPTLEFAFWRDDWAFYWGALRLDHSFLTLLYHPGTVAEFLILSRVFGQQALYWNFFGMLLKILASISVFRFSKSWMKSRTGGMIAGILFAATPIGLESVGWTAAHVVLLNTIFCCYAGYYFITYRETRLRIAGMMSLSFFIFALVSDPIRTAPVILFFMLYYWYVYRKTITGKTFFRFSVLICLSFIFLLFVLFLNKSFLTDLRITKAVEKHGLNWLFYIHKILLSATDFLGSIGNMFLGMIGIVKDVMGFSQRSIVNISIGFVVMVYGMHIFVKALKNKRYEVPLFAILWVFLFYVPNWVFAIFNTVGVTNRYLVLSSVGLYVFLSWLFVTYIHSRKLLVITVVIFCVYQMSTTYQINVHQGTYRSSSILGNIYNTMDREVPKENKQYLFVMTGEGEVFTNGIMMNLQMPFIVYRNIDERNNFPIMVSDFPTALSYMCGEKKTFGAAWEQIPVTKRIHLEDVFSWRVNKEGQLIPIHENIRERLRISTCQGKLGT